MKKITVQDLNRLSDIEKGLVFNYFGAVGGNRSKQKMALGTAIMALGLIGWVYLLELLPAGAEVLPSWFPAANTTAMVLAILEGVLVLLQVRIAKEFNARAAALLAEIEAHGLDVSGLAGDQVFEHLVLPMMRKSGLPIQD